MSEKWEIAPFKSNHRSRVVLRVADGVRRAVCKVYDERDADLVVKAPEMFELLERINELCRHKVLNLSNEEAAKIQQLLNDVKGGG